MSTTHAPRSPRASVASVLRRAFAPYATTTAVALHGAGWVTSTVAPLPGRGTPAAAPSPARAAEPSDAARELVPAVV